MHRLAIACCGIAAAAFAQSPLVTLNQGGNQGNEGGGVYFDLTVNTTITINAFNFRAGNTGANPSGSVNMGQLGIWLGPTTWVGNVQNMSLWTQVAQTQVGNITHNATGANPGVISPGPLVTPFALGPGTYGVALQSASGTFNHNYTNGNGTNQNFSTAELSFAGGGAQNAFLSSGGIFNPRIWNGEIEYTTGGTPIAVASQEQYGNGCYGFYTSFYELFPNPASIDVDNLSARLTFAGPSYAVGPGVNAYAPPSASAVPLTFASATSTVNLSTVFGGTLPFPVVYPLGGTAVVANDLEVCSVGYITPVATVGGVSLNAPDGTPTVDDFLGQGGQVERWCPHWKGNQNPVTAGQVLAEVDAAGDLVVSWVGVAGNTYQIAYSPVGDVEYRYLTMSVTGGGSFPVILGWTQGGGALDNEIDFSVDTQSGFLTDPSDNTPLDMVLDARPVLGTNPNVVVSGYDQPSTTVGFVLLSFIGQNPGLPLVPFVNMPGCERYIGDAVGNGIVNTGLFFVAGPTHTQPFIAGGIPNIPSLNGVLLYGQSATATGMCAGAPCNGAGFLSSNGLRMLIGSL